MALGWAPGDGVPRGSSGQACSVARACVAMATLLDEDRPHSLPSRALAGKMPLFGGVERKEPGNAQ